MDLESLKAILSVAKLRLKTSDAGFETEGEGALTVLLLAGNELVRLTKVKALDFEASMGSKGLLGLQRDGAYTVVPLNLVIGVEREGEASDPRRRTGFV